MPTNVTPYNIPVPDNTDPVNLAGTSGDLAAMATAVGTALDGKLGDGATISNLTITNGTVTTLTASTALITTGTATFTTASFGTATVTAGTATNLTVSNPVAAPNYTVGLTTEGSNTVALDFATGDGFVTRTATGAVTITGTGYAAGVTKTVRIVPGASARDLTVPAGWVFVGNAAGTAIAANKTAVVTATAFGTAEADVVAAFAVQP